MIYGDVRPATLVMTAAGGRPSPRNRHSPGARSVTLRHLPPALRRKRRARPPRRHPGPNDRVGALRGFIAFAPDDLPRMEMIRLAGTPLLVAFVVTHDGHPHRAGAASRQRSSRSRHAGASAGRPQRDGEPDPAADPAGPGVGTNRARIGRARRREPPRPQPHPAGNAVVRVRPGSPEHRSARPPALRDTSYVPWIRLLDRALPARRARPGVQGVYPTSGPALHGSNTFTGGLEAEGRGSGPNEVSPIRLVRGRCGSTPRSRSRRSESATLPASAEATRENHPGMCLVHLRTVLSIPMQSTDLSHVIAGDRAMIGR